MATTQIADLQLFLPYIEQYAIQQTTEKTAFLRSGIATQNPLLQELVNGHGSTLDIPFFNDLTGDSVVGSDNPATTLTAQKVTSGKQTAIKLYRNNGWDSANLAGDLVSNDPTTFVGTRLSTYWARELQKIMVAIVRGVEADNIANDSGDMVYDIATDDAGAVTDAEKISAEAIIRAEQTMGDMSGGLAGLAVHSAVHTQLKLLNLIDFTADSEQNVGFGTYQGKTLIVDDGLPAIAGTNRITYTSVLFGNGAFNFAEGAPETGRGSLVIDEDEKGGNGSGVTSLISRRKYVVHPTGFRYTGASQDGGPTNAVLDDAASWDRVFDRKNVPMAFVRTNG